MNLQQLENLSFVLKNATESIDRLQKYAELVRKENELLRQYVDEDALKKIDATMDNHEDLQPGFLVRMKLAEDMNLKSLRKSRKIKSKRFY